MQVCTTPGGIMKGRFVQHDSGTVHLVNRFEHRDEIVAVTECGEEIIVDSVPERSREDDICGRCA